MNLRDTRHVEKLWYMPAGGRFYEELEEKYQPLDDYKRIAEELARDARGGWLIERSGCWYHVYEKQISVPAQGWKIHTSATPANGHALLRKAASILLAERV